MPFLKLDYRDVLVSSLFEKARQAEHAMLRLQGRSTQALSRSELIQANAALAVLAAAAARGFHPNPNVLRWSGSAGGDNIPTDSISYS